MHSRSLHDLSSARPSSHLHHHHHHHLFPAHRRTPLLGQLPAALYKRTGLLGSRAPAGSTAPAGGNFATPGRPSSTMAAEMQNSTHPSVWVSDGNCSGSVYVGLMGRELDAKDNFTLCSATYSMEMEKTSEPDLSEIHACCFENEGDYNCEHNNCLFHDPEHVAAWKACVRAAESNLFSCTVYPIQKKYTSGATRAAVRLGGVLTLALAVVSAL